MPLTAPGARTVETKLLPALLQSRRPVVVQATSTWQSIPGAIGLAGAGAGGTTSDSIQNRLRSKMIELTRGKNDVPVLALGWNSERTPGRNLVLRLVALGYTEVYWYRGGVEAWEVAGLPETLLGVQSW